VTPLTAETLDLADGQPVGPVLLKVRLYLVTRKGLITAVMSFTS